MATFEEVLPVLRNGGKVKLAHWQDGCYMSIDELGSFYFKGPQYFELSHILLDTWELTEENDDTCKVGSVCFFWDESEEDGFYGILGKVEVSPIKHKKAYYPAGCETLFYHHCRGLSDAEKGVQNV